MNNFVNIKDFVLDLVGIPDENPCPFDSSLGVEGSDGAQSRCEGSVGFGVQGTKKISRDSVKWRHGRLHSGGTIRVIADEDIKVISRMVTWS